MSSKVSSPGARCRRNSWPASRPTTKTFMASQDATGAIVGARVSNRIESQIEPEPAVVPVASSTVTPRRGGEYF